MSSKRKNVKKASVDSTIPAAQPESVDTSKHLDPATGKLLERNDTNVPANMIHLQFVEHLATVNIDLIDIDLPGNKRDEVKDYDLKDPQNKSLIESLDKSGMVPGKRPLCHKGVNGRFRAIQGHRRLLFMKQLGWTTVPIIWIEGATPAQLTSMINDPIEKANSKIGQYKQMKALLREGATDAAWLATRIGIRESSVQALRSLCRLPVSFQDYWIRYQRSEESLPFTPDDNVIKDLYAAQLRDERGQTLRDGKTVPSTRAPFYDPEGPEYKERLAYYEQGKRPPKGRVTQDSVKDDANAVLAMGAPALAALIRGVGHLEGIDRTEALNSAVKIAVSYSDLEALASKLANPYFTALINGPTVPTLPDGKPDKAQYAVRHEALAVLFSDAVNHFIGVNPERALLSVWDTAKPAPESVKPETAKPSKRNRAKV